MNKTNLAIQIDHALKDAGFTKSRIKGNGWKGRGTRYRESGFIISTNSKDGVLVGHHVHDLLSIKLYYLADTHESRFHLMKIHDRKSSAIRKYILALEGFDIQEMIDEYNMPYLLVTGVITEVQHG